MKNSQYQCVNCGTSFHQEGQYMAHYKSEHHRYNIKRRLIGLPPLSLQDYQLQFEEDQTSKQSSQLDFYCDLCCKKFMSAGTYKQHLNSKKHKGNREKIKCPEHTILSRSSSSSDFSIIGGEKAELCFFCYQNMTRDHLKNQHNFPPFYQECINPQGLKQYVKSKIIDLKCVFCNSIFTSQESVRQHMTDVGHSKLNLENFGEYEKFYLWKIEESSSQSEQDMRQYKEENSENNSFYEVLKNPTLEDLEKQRQKRIQYTATGVIINGKQMGYRCYREYYKQYLGRDPQRYRRQQPLSIGCEENTGIRN